MRSREFHVSREEINIENLILYMQAKATVTHFLKSLVSISEEINELCSHTLTSQAKEKFLTLRLPLLATLLHKHRNRNKMKSRQSLIQKNP